MNQHSLSLVDVLIPPVNQWLKEISRRKADLPEGVRVVRFSDADEDGRDASEPATTDSRSRRKPAASVGVARELAISDT